MLFLCFLLFYLVWLFLCDCFCALLDFFLFMLFLLWWLYILLFDDLFYNLHFILFLLHRSTHSSKTIWRIGNNCIKFGMRCKCAFCTIHSYDIWSGQVILFEVKINFRCVGLKLLIYWVIVGSFINSAYWVAIQNSHIKITSKNHSSIAGWWN